MFVSCSFKLFLTDLVLFDAGLEAQFGNPGEFKSLDLNSFLNLNCGLFLLELSKEHAWLHSQIQCQDINIFYVLIDWDMNNFTSSNLFRDGLNNFFLGGFGVLIQCKDVWDFGFFLDSFFDVSDQIIQVNHWDSVFAFAIN